MPWHGVYDYEDDVTKLEGFHFDWRSAKGTRCKHELEFIEIFFNKSDSDYVILEARLKNRMFTSKGGRRKKKLRLSKNNMVIS